MNSPSPTSNKDEQKAKYCNVPVLVTTNNDIHDFVHHRRVLFEDFPFLMIKPEIQQNKEIKKKLLGVDTFNCSLTRLNEGHYQYEIKKNPDITTFESKKCLTEEDDCQEEEFWQKSKIEVLYGSDNLTDPLPKTPLWDLKEVYKSSSPLNCLQLLSDATTVGGITEPYAYYGYPKSCFPLHREDLDLCSVNYLHQGKPKVWYGWKAKDNDRVEEYLKKVYSVEYSICEQAFRHKNFFLHLQTLQEYFPDLDYSF